MSMVNVLLTPFRTPAFTWAGVSTSWGELAGFVSGALCVWLVARQNVWNWPVGILNNVAFFALFADNGLYTNAGLQVVFFALAVYGWWSWLRGGEDHTALRVTRTTAAQWWALLASGAVGGAALVWLLVEFTDSAVPVPDALTTVLSLLATWGQARKKIESWWLWIAADVIYVPLYAYQGLWLTSALYVLFLALCVLGLRSWLADHRSDIGRVAAR
jgi:nicotinamide mononucleotide transporter